MPIGPDVVCNGFLPPFKLLQQGFDVELDGAAAFHLLEISFQIGSRGGAPQGGERVRKSSRGGCASRRILALEQLLCFCRPGHEFAIETGPFRIKLSP